MPQTLHGRRGPASPDGAVLAVGRDVVLLAACIGLAALLGLLLGEDTTPERTFAMLAFACGATAAALLGAASWVGVSRRAARVGLAVAAYTAVPLLLRAAGMGGASAFWALAGSVAALGAVGVLVLAVRGVPAARERAAYPILGVAALGVLAIGVTHRVAPALVPAPALVATVEMLTWSGAAAVGVMLVIAGSAPARPLLRRTGVAFVVLAAAHATALLGAPEAGDLPLAGRILELGATMLLLAAAVAAMLAAVHTQRAAHADLRLRLDAARDRVPPRREPAPSTAVPPARAAAATTDVGQLVRDLVVLHRSSGLDVALAVESGLRAAIDQAALAQAITNLLVNCERHAPGAHVEIRVSRRGECARVEVADDGPGLPAGAAPTVLRRDAPGSGLPSTAEIVDRYGGTFTLTSQGSGCTATMDLPLSTARAHL